MKIKKELKKITGKFIAGLVCLGLIVSGTFISPTVLAKTTYGTLAFDKKLETRVDFEKGELKNIKIKEDADGIELEVENNERGEYVASVVEAPFEANYIGLHWKSKNFIENSIVVTVQFSDDGINFGEWINANVELDETRDDKKNEEIFAALVGVDNKKFARAKISFVGRDGKFSKLNNFTLTFINSGDASKKVDKKLSLFSKSTAIAQSILKTSPNGQNLNVISREEWGADESYRFDRKGKEEWPRSYHGTRKIIIHHTGTASSNGVTDFEANKAAVRAAYYYHAVTQNWGDIGYNALVDALGNVYEGRYGTHGTSATRSNPTSEQVMELDTEAGHTSGYNVGSFGVSALGDFTAYVPTSDQQSGIKNVIAYVADSRGIDIQGYSDFRLYDGTWHRDLNNVVTHRDATATACPGEELYRQTQPIKTAADNSAGIMSNLDNFNAIANGVSISGESVGLTTINFDWNQFLGATQYQYVLEKVFGTTGVANDSEPWSGAWFNAENSNVKTIMEPRVVINGEDLAANSNYVFYVRALDSLGNPISNTKHVNFTRDSSAIADTLAPVVNINSPTAGTIVGVAVIISASATDNGAMASMELYIDNVKKISVAGGSLSYNWNTKKIATGTHNITVRALDASGNLSTISITVTK